MCSLPYISGLAVPTLWMLNIQKFLEPSFIGLWLGGRHLQPFGHTGRRVVLSHTLSTLQHVITKISHNVLSNFMILCWAAFIDILSCRWDTPSGKMRPLGKVWGDGLGPWNSALVYKALPGAHRPSASGSNSSHRHQIYMEFVGIQLSKTTVWEVLGTLSPLTVFSSIWATGEAMIAILLSNAQQAATGVAR